MFCHSTHDVQSFYKYTQYTTDFVVYCVISPSDTVLHNSNVIRSILECACPVLHPALTKKLSKATEGVQKCCLKLLYPPFSNIEARSKSGVDRLDYRRDMIT